VLLTGVIAVVGRDSLVEAKTFGRKGNLEVVCEYTDDGRPVRLIVELFAC
jgi:hypothetical protein